MRFYANGNIALDKFHFGACSASRCVHVLSSARGLTQGL